MIRVVRMARGLLEMKRAANSTKDSREIFWTIWWANERRVRAKRVNVCVTDYDRPDIYIRLEDRVSSSAAPGIEPQVDRAVTVDF